MDNLLNIIWDFSTDGFALTSEEGIVLKSNPSFGNITGMEAGQIVGKSLFSFFTDDTRDNAKSYFEKIIYQDDLFPKMVLSILCLNGSEKKVEFNVTNTKKDEQQKIVLAIFKDITKQEEYELGMIKAKERIEESDRLKTAFLTNMSHEIRTPMNGIIGFSGMLLDPGLGEDKLRHFVELIVASCNLLLDLINDIIDLSRIEAGQIEINKKEFYLNDLLNDIYSFFYSTAQSKGIRLVLKQGLEMQDSRIISDEHKLRQILVNLLSNALKFTSEGTVEYGYTITTKEIEFYVSDTGIGIEKVHYKAIFERFTQADYGNTRQYGGTGIGLPISKSFVELLGGRIWFKSMVGSGSTFYFTVPYHSISREVKYTEISITERSWQSKTVLIAEDEEINYIYLTEALLETKINIIRAINGYEVIDIIKHNPNIDLVLMDIKMPEMNGYEATKIVKQIKPQIPIIAQTAYAMASDRENALAIGCDDYISKPVKKEKLLSIIQKFLV